MSFELRDGDARAFSRCMIEIEIQRSVVIIKLFRSLLIIRSVVDFFSSNELRFVAEKPHQVSGIICFSGYKFPNVKILPSLFYCIHLFLCSERQIRTAATCFPLYFGLRNFSSFSHFFPRCVSLENNSMLKVYKLLTNLLLCISSDYFLVDSLASKTSLTSSPRRLQPKS